MAIITPKLLSGAVTKQSKEFEIESKEIDREKIFPLLQGIDHL
jgi:hypothetical protein